MWNKIQNIVSLYQDNVVLPHQWLALLHNATPCLLLFSTAGKKMLRKESTCIECAWAKEISHRDINKRLEQKKKKTINNFPPPFTLFYVLPLSCAGEMGMDVTFHNISSLQLHHLLLLQHGLPTQSSLPRTAPTWVCTTGPSLRNRLLQHRSLTCGSSPRSPALLQAPLHMLQLQLWVFSMGYSLLQDISHLY